MKKTLFIAFFVVVMVTVALAFVACKNIEDSGEIQQPPAPEQGASGGDQGEELPGGDENPDEGGENGGEKNPDEGQNPPQSSAKTVVELLKEIIVIGEADYDAISAEVAAGNMTLTAEKIKAVGDHFPALEKDAESGKDAKDVENADVILQNKEAFVAQAEGEMEDVFKTIYPEGYEEWPSIFDEDDFERKYVVTYKKNFTFEGEFNLDEIDIIKADGAQGDFSNATLTNGGSKILIDKLNEIRGSSLPTLFFEKTNNISEDSSEKDTYDLYKSYSKELGKLQLKGDLNYNTIDGKQISGDSNYTLFEKDGNTVKSSGNGTIKSLTADTLVQMTNQLKIYRFHNMIISGNATEPDTVNWELRNIVFEGDMSKIKNEFKNPTGVGYLNLYGIIYFKNKPYNNSDVLIGGQGVEGMLKLDNLQGVSRENFEVDLNSNYYSVLDVRGASLDNYDIGSNEKISQRGGYIHAIYFNESYSTLKDNQTKINELCNKFADSSGLGIINAYLGNVKVKGHTFNSPSSNTFSAASRTPRTLKEFEEFGNSSDENRGYMQFKKSAKSSYEGHTTDWDNLEQRERDSLTADESKNRLAKNDRRSCKAKSFV